LGEGALLICLIDAGPRGAQVRKVLQLIDAGSNPEPLKSAIEHGCPANSDKIAGAIKWYKPEKGFGFVVADNGGKDVFIHKTCLERHGLDTIETGKRLLMTIKTVAKGREVIDFEILDN
jgi:CspA family cold shock protein